MRKLILFLFLSILIFVGACSPPKSTRISGVPPYVPASKELHDAITRMDSIFFDAYNNCKLDVFESVISQDLEFYHDQGGLSTSKSELITALKNNICGKVTRELLEGSIEVYPIPNYGAVQMGAHRFYNKENNNTASQYAKFVQIWHQEDGMWKLTRVISLH
jgi:hypothetical protein